MKYIKLTIAALASIWIFSGCKHDKDLFVSPNTPTAATASTLLTSAEVATMNTYEGDLTRFGGILVQHSVGATGQPTSIQVYSLPQQLFDNQWTQIYQTLLTLQTLKDNFGAESPYYTGIANIVMVMNWGICTDMFGDIPYSQALKGDAVRNPQLDAQQAVIQGMLNMLDSSISLLSNASATNAFTPGTDDIMFSGATDKWIATAYTLKARYLNRLSKKSNYDPAAILDALSKGIQSADGDCMAIHGAQAQESNQWYAYLSARGYIVACETLVDSMLLRPTDTRVYYYYDSTGYGGMYGSPVAVTTDQAPYWGAYLAASSETPTPLVTYFEAMFIKAEVEARTGAGTAAADLNTAIMENCKKVTGGTYDGSDIATYTAGNTNVSRVMYEKWIAMFGQAEAYNDYRRTGFPNLTPNSAGAISTIPARYPMPDLETNANPNARIISITTPVWWGQ